MSKNRHRNHAYDCSRNERFSAMWWKLSVKEREKHNHLITVLLFSPFLFSGKINNKKWMDWCRDAKLIQDRGGNEVLSEEEHNSVDLVEDALNRLKDVFSYGSPYQRCREIMDDIDNCVEEFDVLQDAVKSVRGKGWFSSLRGTLKAENMLKKEAAILLTTWLFCDYVRRYGNGERPMDHYDSLSSLDGLDRSRDTGKDCCANGDFEGARIIYTEMIQERRYSYILYGNRSLCYLKLQEYRRARDDGRRTVILNSSWEKGHYRYAQALEELGHIDKGLVILRRAIKLCEKKSDLTRLLHSLQSKVDVQKEGVVTVTKPRKKTSKFGRMSDLPALVDPASDDESIISDKESEGETGYVSTDWEDSNSEDEEYIRESLQNSPPPPLIDNTEELVIEDELIPAIFAQYIKKGRVTGERRGKAPRKNVPAEEKPRAPSKSRKPQTEKAEKKEHRVESTHAHTERGTERLVAKETADKAHPCAKVPVEPKKKVSQSKENVLPIPFDVLREGSAAMLENKFAMASSYYRKALTAFHEEGSKYNLAKDSEAVVLYALGTAYLKQGSMVDLELALEQYELIIKKCDVGFVLAYFGIGRVYFSQNRFYEARSPLQKILGLVQTKALKVKTWPGTDKIIEESKKIVVLKFANSLLSLCLYPPRPFAICRFQQCQQLKTYIYFSDPDFKGFIRLRCNEGCLIDYHFVCWKKFRTEELESRIEKDVVDKDCFTPNCNGYIKTILRYDEEARRGSSYKVTASSTRERNVCQRVVDKSARTPVSSQRHLARIEARKERRRQKKAISIQQREEKEEHESVSMPSVSRDEPQRSWNTEQLDDPGISVDEYIDPTSSVGTVVLSKEEETDLFPAATKAKKKKKKNKPKTQQPAMAKDHVQFRFEDNDQRLSMAVLQDSEEGRVVSEGEATLPLYMMSRHESEFQTYRQFQQLLLRNGFLHLHQQETDIYNQLDENAKRVVEDYGGFHAFLAKFPFYLFDAEDPNLVSLKSPSSPEDNLDVAARLVIAGRYHQDEWKEMRNTKTLGPVAEPFRPRRDRQSTETDSFSSFPMLAASLSEEACDIDEDLESVTSESSWLQGSSNDTEAGPRNDIPEMMNNVPQVSGSQYGSTPFCLQSRILSSQPFTRAPFLPFVSHHFLPRVQSPITRPLRPDFGLSGEGVTKYAQGSLPPEMYELSGIDDNEDLSVHGNFLQHVQTGAEIPDGAVGSQHFKQSKTNENDMDTLDTWEEDQEQRVVDAEMQTDRVTEVDGSLQEKVLLSEQLERAKDALQKEKSRSNDEIRSLKEQLNDLKTQSQALKEEREQGKKLLQVERKKHQEELKALQQRMNEADVARKTAELEKQERLIVSLKEKNREAKLREEQNEDIVVKMTRSIDEQSARAQKAEVLLVDAREKLVESMFAPVKDRIAFALNVLSGNAHVNDPHKNYLKTQWRNFQAAIEMECQDFKERLRICRQELEKGRPLDHSTLPVFALPQLREPQVPLIPLHAEQRVPLQENQAIAQSPRCLASDPMLSSPRTRAASGTQQVGQSKEMPPHIAGTMNGMTAGPVAGANGTLPKTSDRGPRVVIRDPCSQEAATVKPLAHERPTLRDPPQEPKSQIMASGTTVSAPSSRNAQAAVSRESDGDQTIDLGQNLSLKNRQRFQEIIQSIGNRFPELLREDIEKFLTNYRRTCPGSKLSGMPSQQIIDGVEELIKTTRRTNGQVATSKLTASSSHGKVPCNANASVGYNKAAAARPLSKANPWGKTNYSMQTSKQESKQYGLGEPCVICHDDLTSHTKKLACGHTFHNQCIEPWLKEKRTCPTCREYAIPPEEYPKLK